MGDVKFLPEMLGVGGGGGVRVLGGGGGGGGGGGSGSRNGGIDFIMGEWGREILST